MINKSLFCCAVVVTLLFLSSSLQAQEQFFPDISDIKSERAQLPDSQNVLDARERIHSIMQRVDTRIQENNIVLPEMPNIEALPQSTVPAEDIANIAQHYESQGFKQIKPKGLPDLFVLVSFSMPKGAIEKLIAQSEKSGATLVFRGLKGDSMAEMGKAIEKILKGRNVQVVIHPPAFQQFSIKQVPAFVLANQEAGKVLDDGCAMPNTFVKVSGDVTLDYALEYIGRHNQEWAAVASSYQSRIVQGL